MVQIPWGDASLTPLPSAREGRGIQYVCLRLLRLAVQKVTFLSTVKQIRLSKHALTSNVLCRVIQCSDFSANLNKTIYSCLRYICRKELDVSSRIY